MPRGVMLHIPFPSRISPDVEVVRPGQLSWPRSFDLLATPDEEAHHLRGGYAELAARFHPTAIGADLTLAVDQLTWYFLFDDSFDGPLGEVPEDVRRRTDEVSSVLDAPSGRRTRTEPIVIAFADLWARSSDGMSASWCARAARNWRSYLCGYVAEAVNRAQRAAPSFTDLLALRSETIGVQGVLDLAERVGHFELPEPVYHSSLLTSMRRITAEVVVLDAMTTTSCQPRERKGSATRTGTSSCNSSSRASVRALRRSRRSGT